MLAFIREELGFLLCEPVAEVGLLTSGLSDFDIHDITLEWYGLSVVQDTTVFSWDCCEDFCLQRFPKKNQTLLNVFETSVHQEEYSYLCSQI